MDEFSRTALLIGKAGITKLKKSTVVVFGIGGVGSHCIEALARSGVGRLILIDNDTVSDSNINRQSIALHSTIGMYKTDVMENRIHDICPKIEVIKFKIFVLPNNISDIFSSIGGHIDYIVDAIDTVSAKLAIIMFSKENNIPIISSMGTGNKLHAEMFEIADISQTSVCPLCRVMRKELRNRNIYNLKVLYSKEEPIKQIAKNDGAIRPVPASIAFVPPVAGLLIAGEVIRDLLNI